MDTDSELKSDQLKLELFDASWNQHSLPLQDIEDYEAVVSEFDEGMPVTQDAAFSTSSGVDKKKVYKERNARVMFTCSVYQKKLIKLKASRSGMTLSELCRRSVLQLEVKERLSEDYIEGYKSLVRFISDLRTLQKMIQSNDTCE